MPGLLVAVLGETGTPGSEVAGVGNTRFVACDPVETGQAIGP